MAITNTGSTKRGCKQCDDEQSTLTGGMLSTTLFLSFKVILLYHRQNVWQQSCMSTMQQRIMLEQHLLNQRMIIQQQQQQHQQQCIISSQVNITYLPEQFR